MTSVEEWVRLRPLEAEDGIYHVLNRGNYRADIFRSDKTKAAFLQSLGEACGKTGWRVHAWCIMSNHFHLAVEPPRGNLVETAEWGRTAEWGQALGFGVDER